MTFNDFSSTDVRDKDNKNEYALIQYKLYASCSCGRKF